VLYRSRLIVASAVFLTLSTGSQYCAGQQGSRPPSSAQENYLGIPPESTPLYPELKRAFLLSQAHRADEAAAGYRDVLEKAVTTGDKPAQALTHAGLSSIFQAKADYPAARLESAQALALLQALQNPRGVAQVEKDLGTIAYFMGDLKIAQQYLQQALLGFEGMGMLREQAATLRVLDMAGAPDGEKLLQHALAIAQQLGDKPMEAALLQNFGDGLFTRGQFDAAQEKYTEAALIYQQAGNELGLAYVLTSEGRLQRAHGHPEKAIPLYQQALAFQEKAGDRFGVIQSTNAMAVAYQALDNAEKAIQVYTQALAMAKATGSKRIIDFELGNLAASYNSVGKYQEAIPILEEMLRGDTGHADYRYSSLGIAYFNLGQYQQAVKALTKAIDLSRQAENWDVLPEALITRAQVEEKLGNESGALADAEESLRVIERVREHTVPTDSLKRGFSETNQSTFGIYAGLLEHAHQPERALEVAEEARSRAFLDLMATRDLQTKTAAPLQVALPREPQEQLLAQSSDKANAAPGSQGTVFRGDSSEAAALRNRWNSPDPELRSLVSVPAFSLAQVQATARRLNSTILSYWVTSDETYIWVVPPQGATHSAVANTSWKRLEELIAGLGPGSPEPDTKKNEARFQAPQVRVQRHASASISKESAVASQVRARGGSVLTAKPNHCKKWHELYSLLIEPVETWLPSKPASLLTIEPYGPLLRLPFAALTDRQGRYLLERFSLHYTPAVSLLQFTQRKKEETQHISAHYLLVADPSGMLNVRGESTLPALPGSRREVAAVARLLPAGAVTLLEGRQAVEGEVSKLAGQNTVIHLATHGIIRDDQPFASYLALGANRNHPEENGRLTAQEIYGLDLHADLVFLSACRSGTGKVSGDGLVGLTRAFWYAGTASVIASLWDVADEPTSRLVANFYRLWLQGNDKSRALRLAQLRLLRQLRAGQVIVPTSAGNVALPEDPMFWAGFVLQGEP